MLNFFRLISFVIILLVSNFSLAHDYYVSITTIDIRSEKGTAEISIKLTAHDLEKAILQKDNIDLNLGSKKENPKADSILHSYFVKHLKFWVNNKFIKLSYLGKEVETDENLWIYLEGNIPGKIKTFKIFNDILIHTFSGQNNILHIHYRSLPISFTFTGNQTEKIFDMKD